MNILDLIFPKECLGCGREGNYFCKSCRLKIVKVSQICPVCEKPSLCGESHALCRRKNTLSGLYSFFKFESVVRSAIHKIKYEYVTDIFPELFSVLFREWQESNDTLVSLNKFVVQNKPVLVPIPLHWRKENIRGFNQSALLGKALAKKLKLSLREGLLVKQKPTASQMSLNSKDRGKNIKGVFRVKKHAKGLNIVLIDDVWTTGATMKEATKVLKEAGAKDIWGLTICR